MQEPGAQTLEKLLTGYSKTQFREQFNELRLTCPGMVPSTVDGALIVS